MRYLLLLTSVIALLCCSSFDADQSDQDLSLGSEIIRVTTTPNPVKLEGVVEIQCFVADSLREDATYFWTLPDSDTTTAVNTISWKAPIDPGNYPFRVFVVNPSPGQSANTNFTVEVIP